MYSIGSLGLATLSVFFPAIVQAAATTPNPGLKYYYPAPDVPVVDVEADVIVYGGTSGGVVAAVQAARKGKTVALIVFGRHVGGMTSGGLTRTDGVNSAVQGGITREYFDRVGRNSGFTPTQAEVAFESFLADPVPGVTWDQPIPTFYEQRIDWVEKDGARIVALHMENGSVFRGRMFIDCSYEGDLMARAGVSYTYGREPRSKYDESRAGKTSFTTLPGVNSYNEPGNPASGLIYNLIDEPRGVGGEGDDHVQAYNFRMYTVQNSNPAAIRPLFQPEAYNPDNFEILYRYHRSGGTTSMSVGNDINNHQMFNRGCSTDHIGGNRWPDGNGGWIAWADADYATRELMFQSHVAWQLGMLWYIKTDARYRSLATDPDLSSTVRSNIQSLLNKVDQLGLPLSEYPETNGWPHELYVREARRMVSDLVITQAHYERKIVVHDSVGLANYSADSHHVRRIPGTDGGIVVEGDTGGSAATPWRIPYRALVPKQSECENLLVPWALSASHVAFCSTRMEPCLMVLSQSAATAAALALDRGEAVQQLPYEVLRLHLIADGQILGETSAAPPETGIIVDNSSSSGFSTVGAWIASSATSGYYGSNYLHDDNTAANGYSATYAPSLPESEEYEVFLRWTSHSNRADNVPVDIHHANGTNTISINQRSNGGKWVSVGVFSFLEGNSGSVVIRNDAANGYVIADSVRFLSTATVEEPVPGLHLIVANPIAREAGGVPATVKFVRDNDNIAETLTVYFSATGNAVSGQHFAPLPASVTIPANQRSVLLNINPIADDLAQGTRNLVLTLTENPAYIIGAGASAEIQIHDKPYDHWRFIHFSPSGLANSPESIPSADPDGDDRINQIEFLLGSDPLSGAIANEPQISMDILTGKYVFQYTRPGQAAEIDAVVQYTTSLESASWTDLPVAVADTIYWNPATGDRIIRQSIPVSEAAQIFFRLKLP